MADTIRDFLIGLGFVSDSAQESKFIKSIEYATEKAILMADAIEEGAKKIAEAVEKTSEDYTSLGHLSDRLQTGAVAIKAFEEAFARMGSSKGDADAVLNSLDAAMRDPSRKAALAQWKVTSKDLVEAAQQLGAAMRGQPDVVQNMIAGFAGITLSQRELLTKTPTLTAIMKEATESAARSGITDEQISKEKEFGETLQATKDDISNVISGTWLKVTTGQMQKPLEQFDGWLKENQTGMTTRLTAVGDAFSDLIPTDLTFEFNLLIVALKAVNVYLETIRISLGLVGEAWRVLRGGDPNTPERKKAEEAFSRDVAKGKDWIPPPDPELGSVKDTNAKVVDALSRLGNWLFPTGKKNEIKVGGVPVSSGNPLPVTLGDGDLGGGHAGGTVGSGGGDEGGMPSDSLGSANQSLVTSAEGRARGVHLIKHLMDRFGWTKDQATGAAGVMGFESGNFTTMQEGGQAPGHGGWGYEQWTGPRRRQFMAWTAAHKLNPSSVEANEGFLDWEAAGSQKGGFASVGQTHTVTTAADAFLTNVEGMQIGGPGIRNAPGHIGRAIQYSRDPAMMLGVGAPPINKNISSNPVTSVVVTGQDTHADTEMVGSSTDRTNQNAASFGANPVH
jgi:hypothetical protein